MLCAQHAIGDVARIKEMFFAREALMSTGIGLEIGVPHVRLEGVSCPLLAIGISKKGIGDYVSLDNKPVKIVFMIIVNKGAHKEYIRLLAQIATMLKDEDIRNTLVDGKGIEEVYAKLSI